MPGGTKGAAASSARLEVRLLGVVEVILDGRRPRVFNSLRLQRFLALIALRPGPQHRSRLAFELWPDSDEPQARTNLRKLLHELRRALPDLDEFVELDHETVRWKRSGSSEVDVLRFRDAVAGGDLELGARLYRGDFLPACYDDWVLEERAKLRAEACEILARLTLDAGERADHETTIRYAQRIIDLEPTDEAAVRAQMKAYLALGDRGAALRSYHRYVEALERDLAVAPGEAMERLYRELRTGAGDGEGEGAGAWDEGARTAIASESPFVGRELERSTLEEAWHRARDGVPHLVLVTGEPGIGKSRLAQELARRVRAEGHVVVASRAYEAAGRLPWGPVVDLLRSKALEAQVARLESVWKTELARLLPELDHSRASSPSVRASSDQAQRYRLFDAVRRAILSSSRPLLIVVDDLQWCDAETIELIGFVVRSEEAAPVLVVGTVRSEEVPPHHPVARLVEALDRDRAVTTVRLDRFDESTTARLAARLRDEDAIEPNLASRLWSETEGNPLFVVEAVRAGLSAESGQALLTPTMRAVLCARLDQLSDGARRLAEAAAVIGRPFTVDRIASISGSGESGLVDELDELWRRRIIRDRGRTYDFSHDKLRAVALEGVSPARRRQLHRGVAEAIAAERGSDREADSAELAAHYDQAGMVERAVEAYRAAGSRAVSLSALEEAVAMFRRALALLAELPPTSERDALELEVRIALGSPLVALQGYGSREAHELYERALSLCRKLHRAVDPPILRGLGLARLQGCRLDECYEIAQALLDAEARDPIAGTEGSYLLGVSAFWRGDLAVARLFLEDAIEAYDVSRRDEHLALYAQDPKAVCLVRLALVELWSGDAGRAAETARSSLEIARALEHPMTLGYVLTYAAMLACESDDLAALAELLAEAELVWERLSERYLIVVLDALRGWLLVCEGNGSGVEKIAESVARSRREGETLHLTYTLLLLSRARAIVGELREGRSAARAGLSRLGDQHYIEAELWRVDGELAYRSGEAGAAAYALQRAVAVARAQGAAWLELRALHSFASRFLDPALRQRLEEVVRSIPSGHDLPAFRAASAFLSGSG